MTLHRDARPDRVLWWCIGRTPRGEVVFLFAHRTADGYQLRYRDVGMHRVIRERPVHSFAAVRRAAERLQEVTT